MSTAKLMCLFTLVPVLTYASQKEDEVIMFHIGMLESRMCRSAIGDGGLALGAYQMHEAAWADANKQLSKEGKRPMPRSRWRESAVQDSVALAYLRVIRSRLASAGYAEPEYLLLRRCWNRGVRGGLKGWPTPPKGGFPPAKAYPPLETASRGLQSPDFTPAPNPPRQGGGER